MKKKYKSYRDYCENPAKCDICGISTLVDPFGNNTEDPCINCGWKQSGFNLDNPTMVAYPNFLSYDKAKRLFSEGKSLKSTFEDFLNGYLAHWEVGFRYNKRSFGLHITREKTLFFFEFDEEAFKSECINTQEFTSLNEFAQNAQIDGVLVKDLWGKVESTFWLA